MADNPIYKAALEAAAKAIRSAADDSGDHPTAWAMRRIFADLADKILALPVPSLRETLARMVQPLEWAESSIPANAVCHARALYGAFFIDRDADGYHLVYHDSNGIGRFKTLDAAKAAAQADYTRRILAALGVKE